MEKCKKDVLDLAQSINRKMSHDIIKCFNSLKKEVIGDKWHQDKDSYYGDYSPMYYHRRFDFYHIPYIEGDRDTAEFDYGFNSDRMTQWHRIYKKLGEHEGKNYLAEISLLKGYHGGATSGGPDKAGMRHPQPGTPWWRRPPYDPNRYKFWGREAYRSNFNTIDRYEYLFNERVDEIVDQYQSIFDKESGKIMKRYKELKKEYNSI